MASLPNRQLKKVSGDLFRRLSGQSLRTLLIRAGFPYHKSPHDFQWLWVYILLPFLEEESLNELSDTYGKPLRKLYGLLIRYPHAFERLMGLLAEPLFFHQLDEFHRRDASYQSRHRPTLIVDDTQTEKSGKLMDFIHKLFDHAHKRYIMGYNPVLILAVFGDLVFPISMMLWLPKTHPKYRSKNDMTVDFIIHLKHESNQRGDSLEDVEIFFDSAYCKQKVVCQAQQAGLSVISKPSNNHKFEYEGEWFTPKELIEQVKERGWQFLEQHHDYQRIVATHPVYGSVVLIIRRRMLKNKKVIYDVVMSTKVVYNGFQIHKRYRKRWEIELHFKYYKQYLYLGQGHGGKLGAIQSQLYCVALAGLMVALYRHQLPRKVSFRTATRRITHHLYEG